MIVWLLRVAMVGLAPGDIQFYQPKVQFPTLQACLAQGEDVWREYLPQDKQVKYVCDPKEIDVDAPP